MPQYLSPGVYVEEVPSGGAPIAGVGTSTAGFIGQTADQVNVPGEFEEDESGEKVLDSLGDPILVKHDAPPAGEPQLSPVGRVLREHLVIFTRTTATRPSPTVFTASSRTAGLAVG